MQPRLQSGGEHLTALPISDHLCRTVACCWKYVSLQELGCLRNCVLVGRSLRRRRRHNMQPTICLVDAEVGGTSALLHVCGASHRSSRCTMNTKKVSSEDVKREKRVSLEWLCAMVTKGTQALSVCLASCSLLSYVAGPASAKKKQCGLAGCSELFFARGMLWLKSNNESN